MYCHLFIVKAGCNFGILSSAGTSCVKQTLQHLHAIYVILFMVNTDTVWDTYASAVKHGKCALYCLKYHTFVFY